jgi:hypothetical protein
VVPARAVVERREHDASSKNGCPEANPVRSKAVEANWKMLAMPFKRAQGHVCHRMLSNGIANLVGPQELDLNFRWTFLCQLPAHR